MKPFKAFLFLLTILVSFLLILNLNEYQRETPVPDLAVLSEVIDSLNVESDVTTVVNPDEIPVFDSLVSPKENIETALFQSVPFVFAPDDSIGFRFLFNKLAQTGKEKLPVRIIYFGDSQIENDRITSSLRERLQIHFGGKGPGFVPLDHLYNPEHKLIIEISKDWKVHGFQDENFQNHSLLFKNTLLTSPVQKSWFRLKRIHSLKPQPDYELIKLYYQVKGDYSLDVKNSGSIIYAGTLPVNDQMGVLDFQFNRTPDDIRMDFEGGGSLNILGMSLETREGVMVDNVALRGLSYPTFEWSDQEDISQMLRQVNPGLFVFHFGVNLVPYDSDDYIYFRKHFKQQVLFLKERYPEIPLLIIGVSDMARKYDGNFESYKNIPQIKAVQREVAEETGAIFWDLEAFMGGPGGMIRWVNAKPELGRKDYTHFSKEGANKIGEELGRMLLSSFENDSIQTP